MANDPEHTGDEPGTAAAAFARADLASAFGPGFFLTQLRQFVRDHCPPTAEQLPRVEIRLSDGRALDVCHVIGVSPKWVLVAVRQAERRQTEMAVEFVPFGMICGVQISPRHAEAGTAGFVQDDPPVVMPAESLIAAAFAGFPTEADSDSPAGANAL